jgi:MFS family permease
MSHVHDAGRAAEPRPGHELPELVTEPQDASLGTLVSQLSAQIPELIRSELRLAQAEVTEKGKRAGIGIGMFSVAGLLGFFGFAVLLTTIVLLLDLAMPAWLAALIVAVVLLGGAGLAALLGKKKVAEAAPPKPERALSGLKQDLATVKGDR